MTLKDIEKEMENIGFTADSPKSEKYPITYLQLVGLASHFYNLGFNQSVTEIIDADEDYVSSMT